MWQYIMHVSKVFWAFLAIVGSNCFNFLIACDRPPRLDDPQETLYQQAVTRPNEIRKSHKLQVQLVQQVIDELFTLTPQQLNECLVEEELSAIANQSRWIAEEAKATVAVKLFYLRWRPSFFISSTFKDLEAKLEESSTVNVPKAAGAAVITGEEYFLMGAFEESDGVWNKGDVVKAMPYYQNSFLSLYPLASLALGRIYETGIKGRLEPNLPQAKRYYLDADPAHEPKAAVALGRLFQKENNLVEAYKWYKIAALMGHSGAQFCVGRFIHKEYVTENNPRYTYRFWYGCASKQGHIKAQIRLSRILAYGVGLRDRPRAFQIMESLAQMRYLKALHYLGSFFEKGMHVAPDWERACALYRQAADYGFAKSYNNLGALYCKLDKQRQQEARSLFREADARAFKAKGKRLPVALSNLARCFICGIGGDADFAEAKRVLQLIPEYPKALYFLGEIAKREGHNDQAVAHFERAVVKKYPPAYIALARCSGTLCMAWDWFYRYAVSKDTEFLSTLQRQFAQDFLVDHSLASLIFRERPQLKQAWQNSLLTLQEATNEFANHACADFKISAETLKGLVTSLNPPEELYFSPGFLITIVRYKNPFLLNINYEVGHGCGNYFVNNSSHYYIIFGAEENRIYNSYLKRQEQLNFYLPELNFRLLENAQVARQQEGEQKVAFDKMIATHQTLVEAVKRFIQAEQAYIDGTAIQRNLHFINRFEGRLWPKKPVP